MATTSSLGIGAGVDLQSMLSKIIAAERTPITALQTKISSTNSTISLYGTLKSKLDALQSASDTLASKYRLSAMGATSSTETVATASANWLAAPGSYAVEVKQLASAQKSFSTAYTSGTTFGQGDLTFTINGTPHTITLNDQASYTLNDIRGKINAANIGVTATVISGSSGDRLVLTGTQTGAANAFTLSTTIAAPSGQSSLDTLETNDDPVTGFPITTAKDAIIKIDGVQATSSTNTFNSAVNGVTFTAKSLGTTNVSVSTSSARITEAAQALVTAYNDVVTLIKSNSAYDVATKTAQAFNGDSATRSVLTTMSHARTTVPAALSSATLKNLYEVGINIQQNGQMTLDTSKLSAAITKSPDDVTALLTAYGKSFSDAAKTTISGGGFVTNRINGLNSTIKSYQDQAAKLELRVAAVEAGYRKQFTALDTLMSSMTTTSAYLSQQLSKL